jgi:hypothetical protein
MLNDFQLEVETSEQLMALQRKICTMIQQPLFMDSQFQLLLTLTYEFRQRVVAFGDSGVLVLHPKRLLLGWPWVIDPNQQEAFLVWIRPA